MMRMFRNVKKLKVEKIMFAGIIPKLLLWHEFLDDVVKPERINQESCAWIFVDLINHVWHIIEVKNAGLKGRTIESSFAPDKKDFARIKRKAKKYKLTRLGCIHTHIVVGDNKEELKNQSQPSETDIQYARKFNDVIRAIIIVHYSKYGEKGVIHDIIWFDQYGNMLE